MFLLNDPSLQHATTESELAERRRHAADLRWFRQRRRVRRSDATS